MTEAPAPASKSDLPTRFAAGIAMIAVAVVAIYVGGWLFRALVAVAAMLMLIEWGDMHRVRRLWSYAGAVLLAVALLGSAEYLYPAGEMDEVISVESFDPVWQALPVLAGAALFLGLIARRVTMVGGFLYVAVPAFALLVLEWTWMGLVFWAMIVTWSTDTFAYFAGRGIGGPKLAPRISPSKTWAGLIGGMAGAELIGAAAAFAFDLGAPFLYIGGFMGLIAQLGDLYESWLKRRAGVKDSGSILPGHGGVLDRVDGLLPVVLVTLALLMTGQWTG